MRLASLDYYVLGQKPSPAAPGRSCVPKVASLILPRMKGLPVSGGGTIHEHGTRDREQAPAGK
jgi:hypothetical protein